MLQGLAMGFPSYDLHIQESDGQGQGKGMARVRAQSAALDITRSSGPHAIKFLIFLALCCVP